MGGRRARSVVLVPGLGLGARAWQPTLRVLHAQGVDAGSTRVRRLPGYGRRGLREDLSPAVLATQVLGREPADEDEVVLVGHSASCQVVCHVAAAFPERVAGLVLFGPTTDPRAGSWPGLVRRWLATARHEPAWQVPSLVRQYAQTGLATMAKALERARQDSIETTLRRVTCPVVLVRGAFDRIAPADWLQALAAPVGQGRGEPDEVTGPVVRTVTMPAGGHMLPLTHPDLAAAAIGRLLQAGC